MAAESAAEFEQEITCCICHEHYQDPKILPCCHYYCKGCILRIVECYKPNEPFPCPDCREPTVLPENNPDNLPTAFFINRMKELHSRMERVHGKLEALCEMCSGGTAVAFCRQCAHFACLECVKSHGRMNVFSSHVVSTLEDLQKGLVKELPLKDIPLPKCDLHEELTKMFCFNCNQFICRDCIIIDHAGHKYDFVKRAAAEAKEKLSKQLLPLGEVAQTLGSASEEVKNTAVAVKENEQTITEQLRSSFQSMRQIIDDSEAKMLETLSKMAGQKIDLLTAQQKDIDIVWSMIMGLKERVEKTVKNINDQEVLMMHSQTLSRIETELEKQTKEKVNLVPVVEVDIGLEMSVTDELRNLCHTKVRLFHTDVDPTTTTVKGNSTAEINKSSKIAIFVNLPNSLPTRKSVNVKAELESLVDGSVVRAEGVHCSGNEYNVLYTPRTRGHHYLMVTVNGQQIAGSPLSVYVTIPPSQLTDPVRTIQKVISYPKFLAFNSSKQLIVTQGGGDVFIFNSKGARQCTISLDDHGFVDGTGLAIDKNDNIYLTDSCYNTLFKFNKAGALVKVFGRKESEWNKLNSPRGVAVVGERLFVCDSWNHRIQVFSTELEIVDQIGRGGSGFGELKNPKDVSLDSQNQTLYVTDAGNHRIQVFTMSGEFVRVFGKNGSESGELSFPVGICIIKEHVYVVENGNKRVSVFCKDGKFLTSFGEGQLNSPYGVVVDPDGYVYVSDSDGSRVNVY